MNIQGLTQILVGLAWLSVILAVVFVVLRASRNQETRGSGRIIVGLAIFAIFMTIISNGSGIYQPRRTRRGHIRHRSRRLPERSPAARFSLYRPLC